MTAPAFRQLKVSALQSGTGYQHPYYFTVNPVKVTSSALDVMTDLKFLPAATVPGTINAAEAEQIMIARGVRLLLVVDDQQNVTGLITARDLHGPKIMAIIEKRGQGAERIPVTEVMTTAAMIEVLEFDDVLHAHVGDIIETLKESGRQHALVVDHETMTNHQKIRGIFSASQIARQLGIVTSGSLDVSGTFADLEAQINKARA